MTIQALFWDIGGVLLTNGWDREQRAEVVKRFGLDAGEFGERHKLVVPELELGRVSLDEYLDQVVFYQPRDFGRDEFRAAMYAQSQPNPATLALARRLSGQVRMYALNNEGLDLNAHRIDTFGLRELLLGFFTSCYLGVMKPSSAIYRLGVRLAHVPPEQAVMIDDRVQNVEAARRTGMQAILYVSAEQLEADLAALGVQA
ncbi:hydrolase [Deinococcus irradiatisoli]|uniref:Hydrolase n=1 Tax=Deinococcus irradiatisoli TaxID=2202254 RepID=A0A2Z3JMX7_9DEIO|nr:HAD family phosphatase [Deinococcus irradiatisoli]AWN22564.1 hydrolase [Deinococcus irradiatisoli]